MLLARFVPLAAHNDSGGYERVGRGLPCQPSNLIEEARGDDPELASYLRIEERELEAGVC